GCRFLRPFLARLVMGFDGFLQPPGAASAPAKLHKCSAEIVLRRGPLERCALARPFLQRLAIRFDSLSQHLGAALALPKRLKCNTAIVLRQARHPAARVPSKRTQRSNLKRLRNRAMSALGQ